ncbi:MAG: thymidine phosphorylase [Bdellovibrionaceae bacterium]|nr:thymidine phosphorylase [Pseudobdellovibrionaceae bacterium]MDW8190914.1 thymidine phosphorylase [Pseudobdellovibrionaceae bacterium]
MLPAEIIKKKRSGQELTEKELEFFFLGYQSEEITEYQMSAFLMAVFFKGLTPKETFILTKLMMHSGVVLDFKSQNPHQFFVDKHSTGGVGDKTSLLLAPIVSCLGIPVPMISGRGLGHTGGTLDKLESIPGFRTQLSLNEFKNQVLRLNCCLIGQTSEICPLDKRLYALRDVTATVESIPLICASIMSKKLAEGIDGLVLDVKFGSGAFMKSKAEALDLAHGLMKIGQSFGKKVVALITCMNQPLGTYAGNSVEVKECLEVLEGSKLYPDTYQLSLTLAAHMVGMAQSCGFAEAFAACERAIQSGAAREQFEKICKAQGGDLKRLTLPPYQKTILASRAGWVSSFDVEGLGWLNVALGAGRRTTGDLVDPHAGMAFHKKIGDWVNVGEPLVTLFASKDHLFEAIIPRIHTYIHIQEEERPPSFQLIEDTLLSY